MDDSNGRHLVDCDPWNFKHFSMILDIRIYLRKQNLLFELLLLACLFECFSDCLMLTWIRKQDDRRVSLSKYEIIVSFIVHKEARYWLLIHPIKYFLSVNFTCPIYSLFVKGFDYTYPRCIGLHLNSTHRSCVKVSVFIVHFGDSYESLKKVVFPIITKIYQVFHMFFCLL
jgi:hypothetical protein